MNLETYLYDSKHEFKVVLQSQGLPFVKITINDQVKFDQKLIEDDTSITCFANLEKLDPGNICVEMYGKSSRDTVFQNGKILRDTTLTVEDIIINDTSLSKVGQIHSGVYYPIYWEDYTGDKPDAVPGARTLGFNGVWKYNWQESPIRHIINQKELVEQASINTNMNHIFKELGLT